VQLRGDLDDQGLRKVLCLPIPAPVNPWLEECAR
jgi:hypothetical protein